MSSFYEPVVVLSFCAFLDLWPQQSESGLQIDDVLGHALELEVLIADP